MRRRQICATSPEIKLRKSMKRKKANNIKMEKGTT